MRILILGGDGMLGHRLLLHLREQHTAKVTVRQDLAAYRQYGLFDAENTYAGVDVRADARLAEVVADFLPEVVINAAGIVKQRPAAAEVIPSLEINALLPHRLAVLCRAARARLVHMSTDCVFSGSQGHYGEDDLPDAHDLYGRTKLLGEVHEAHCVTVRTSIIGLELARRKSLIEWYLAQRGTIRGFRRAIYSGLTTSEMARVIERVLQLHPDLSGLWHVASAPISKYDLLCRLNDRLGRQDLRIEPDDELVCDRSLDQRRFQARTGYVAPAWDAMLDELGVQIMNRQA